MAGIYYLDAKEPKDVYHGRLSVSGVDIGRTPYVRLTVQYGSGGSPGKLQVNKRTKAVAKARILGLLQDD
jgi:hypothetical protein